MRWLRLLPTSLAAHCFLLCAAGLSQETAIKIGTIGSIAPGGKGEAAEGILKDFIKNEGQLSGEMVRLDTWQQLGEQLANKSMQLGVFQGHEFVWAKEKYPGLRPLVLAVNGPRYPVIQVVTAKTNTAADLAALKGKPFALPGGVGYLRLFVEQQIKGEKPDQFFSKVVKHDTAEEALDAAVDGQVDAAVVDRAALDMYKRRKPARFAKLKDLKHSESLIPPVIAYVEGGLDEATRLRFQKTLTEATKKDRGQSLLNAFRLTSFDVPPADFDGKAQETLKTFPAPKGD